MGYLYVFFMVLFTVAGQLLAKRGALDMNFTWSGPTSLIMIFNRYIILAGVILIVTPVFYYLALKELELSAVFAFTGLNYVLVSLGGKAFFAEKLNKYHYMGMALIFLGLLVFPL
ncbi:hypothetical protein [Phosphitispora fastidiosa]|uniref:hypothetical protein n=1 Tax=Phosphitispora fastidiosa TaxID=2837202 RepID=UPI001E540F39|nr:hypothetical protein [Phosphitispora fastidiosa]MBU7005329.1 putative membrane protein [Phosphitispora fastidiosa]